MRDFANLVLIAGAGIFVTTVVAGAISITQPFHVMERPFLRDCVFYLAAVYFVYWVFDHGRVEVGHAVGFIVLYVVYVLVVIVGRICNARLSQYSLLGILQYSSITVFLPVSVFFRDEARA